MTFVDKQNKVEEDVTKIMVDNETAKENDLFLILKYWQEIDHVHIDIPKEMLSVMTSPESITRARRKIQSDGNLLPENPMVLVRRKVRSELVRNFFAHRPGILAAWEKLYAGTKKGIRRVKYSGGI